MMRLISSKIGQDSVRLNLIKGVCDTCRECRAWDKPGHTVMPSTASPGKFNDEVECDLMFYQITPDISYYRSLHAICYWDGNTGQNDDYYP
eukprot:6231495-Pyramimonas_sp.AAC.1